MVSLLRESSNKLIRLLFSMSQSETGALLARENSQRMQMRQENAREMISVLRRSLWKRGPQAPDRTEVMERQLRKNKRGESSPALSPIPSRPASKRITRLDSVPSLPLTKTVKKGPVTVCGYFKASLVELVLKLDQTQPNFIRCIQPTPKQRPDFFDDDHVERQLRYTGVLQTVQIRRQGYATRLTFKEFLERYRVVHFELTEEIGNPKSACQDVLMHVSCEQGDWQVGHSKVFMRYNVVAELLKMLEFHHMCVKTQKERGVCC